MNSGSALARHTSKRGARRRAAILSAATGLFLEQGYEGARLEEVVRRSGGSLATVYGQFGSKEGLFAAIISEVCDGIVASLPPLDQAPSGTPEDVLFAFGGTYLNLLLTPASLALYRVVLSESRRFPELGRAVFEAGPARAAERLASYLSGEAARGVLVVPDASLAARQFLEMVKADLHFRALLGSEPAPSRPEIEACVRAAVRIFLRGVASERSREAAVGRWSDVL